MSKLLIVGASARAAAMSAVRAGFSPWCSDLFADSDLRAIAPDVVCCPSDRYPSAFTDILRSAPEAPWIYTGGLENHPRLIRRMAGIRPLWGNGPAALALARSPFAIEKCLRRAGLPALKVLAGNANVPAIGRWLRKPLAGSAGQGIAFVTDAEKGKSGRHYFQRYVEGIPMSAVFVRARGRVQMLGTTEQLIGTDWLNAPPFRYAGNVGPIELPITVRETMKRIGTVLGDECGLLGLFGMDFILDGDTPWALEVNPRYPASVEILELATGCRALAVHRLEFDRSGPDCEVMDARHLTWAKAILYAPRRLQIPADWELAPGQFADVPSRGHVIDRGWPILTVLAEGISRLECLAQCRRLADLVMRSVQLI